MPSTHIRMPEEWVNAADEMDVSMAEYVRRMVSAGRRQFGHEHTADETMIQNELKTRDKSSNTNIAEEFILRNLSTETGYQKDELIELITNEDIGEAIDSLADEGEVKYRDQKGGWIKATDNE